MTTEDELLKQYEQELQLAQQANGSGMNPYAPTVYGGGQKQNLVEWELDFRNELEEIERLLRCDVLKRDKDGNEYWERNKDDSKVFLNDLGVNDVLRKIRMMVNKNKVLSHYDVDEIRVRVRMIAHELRVLVYNNSEAYGIDNEYKMHNYPMIILTIMSLIEDSYRRALGGETHRGLAEQRLVTQNEPLGMQNQMYPQMGQTNKPKHWYNLWGKI